MVAKPLCPLYKYIIKPLDRAYYPELRYMLNKQTNNNIILRIVDMILISNIIKTGDYSF